MNLMGEYAAANHAVIHARVAAAPRRRACSPASRTTTTSRGRNATAAARSIVHRKGATPAGEGVLGVIPGSMATPGFVVRGSGVGREPRVGAATAPAASMSRTAAREKFRWKQVKPMLDAARRARCSRPASTRTRSSTRTSTHVMAAQADLVDVVARFDPRIVRMADAGEKPED